MVAAGAAVALVVYGRPGRVDAHELSASVRFHRALRVHAPELSVVDWDDDRAARTWAARLLEVDDADHDVGAVLPAFGAPPASVHDDRVHLLLAMVASRAKESRGLPADVLLDEAEQIVLDELDASLVPLAEAVRTYVRADSGRCDALTDVEVDEEPDSLLSGIRGLLIDGAHGCCAVRRGDLEQARARIRRTASLAERLEVALDRVPLLRAWARFSAEDTDAARAQLDAVEVEHLGEADLMRYRMLRSAVAQRDDTLLSILDPAWLSSIVVEGVVEAVGRDAELAAGIEDSDTAQAALRFVDVEVRLVRQARDLHPLFDRRSP